MSCVTAVNAGWSDAGTTGKDAVPPAGDEISKAAGPSAGGGGDSCNGAGPSDGDPSGNGGEECEGIDPSGGGGESVDPPSGGGNEGADTSECGGSGGGSGGGSPSGGGGSECKGVPSEPSRRSFDVAATFLTSIGATTSCAS
jgi:hypothetical protein